MLSDGNTNIPDALRNTSSLMDLLERQYGQLDKTVALSDEYVKAFADQKQVLVDFLRQLSFLARTLGPDTSRTSAAGSTISGVCSNS